MENIFPWVSRAEVEEILESPHIKHRTRDGDFVEAPEVSEKMVWEIALLLLAFWATTKCPTTGSCLNKCLKPWWGVICHWKYVSFILTLDFLPTNHGDISVEHGEMLHQDASTRGNGIQVIIRKTNTSHFAVALSNRPSDYLQCLMIRNSDGCNAKW